ncbi:MAG: flagellar hook-length control protein FliK, partial [Ruminiclostridium sp.]|nr:flagellar hook-length control protein FliK [Ruminiclostridium sp.]
RFELTGETAQIRPPEIQTAEEILERIQNMQDDHTEFTMVLNPESLGRITVKLVMTGERTAVEITAENPETRAILAARSENLQTMLRNNGVELERYQVVSEQENSQFREQSYEGSSKNPYSRNENGNEEDNGDDDDTPNFYDILGNL